MNRDDFYALLKNSFDPAEWTGSPPVMTMDEQAEFIDRLPCDKAVEFVGAHTTERTVAFDALVLSVEFKNIPAHDHDKFLANLPSDVWPFLIGRIFEGGNPNSTDYSRNALRKYINANPVPVAAQLAAVATVKAFSPLSYFKPDNVMACLSRGALAHLSTEACIALIKKSPLFYFELVKAGNLPPIVRQIAVRDSYIVAAVEGHPLTTQQRHDLERFIEPQVYDALPENLRTTAMRTAVIQQEPSRLEDIPDDEVKAIDMVSALNALNGISTPVSIAKKKILSRKFPEHVMIEVAHLAPRHIPQFDHVTEQVLLTAIENAFLPDIFSKSKLITEGIVKYSRDNGWHYLLAQNPKLPEEFIPEVAEASVDGFMSILNSKRNKHLPQKLVTSVRHSLKYAFEEIFNPQRRRGHTTAYNYMKKHPLAATFGKDAAPTNYHPAIDWYGL